MRYLFVTWDGGGNFHAVLPLAQRLVKRGHEVEFLGHPAQRSSIEEHGCSFAPFERAPNTAASSADDALLDDWKSMSVLANAALYRDRLMVGPAGAFAADVLAEVERFKPDAIAVDFFLFGAVAAAERSGLPSAVLWHTVYAPPNVEAPVFGLGRGLPRGRVGQLGQRSMRALNARWWGRSLPSLNATRADLDLPPLDSVFGQFDRLDRVLVMSSAAFDFAALSGADMPANVRYAGPQIMGGARQPAPDEDDPPLVLVSLSTTYQGQEQLLQRAVDALGSLPVQALLTTGPAVSLGRDLPENVEARSWIAHSEVLPRTSLVLTHAGHGTVMTGLAHGVPLVCAPMGRDQPCVAARAVHSGAGLRLPKNPSQGKIATVVSSALADPALKRNAERMGALFQEEIAADRGVVEMEVLGSRSTAMPIG